MHETSRPVNRSPARVRRRPATLAAPPVWLLSLMCAGTVSAQTDYRNLDPGHPVASGDAYPVERYAGELTLAYHFVRDDHRGPGSLHLLTPELTLGIAPGLMVGAAVVLARRVSRDDDDVAPAGARLVGFYNLNTESRRAPAFAVQVEAGLPIGSAGGRARAAVTAVATRSFGRTRAHVNAGIGIGASSGAIEPIPRWRAALAVDRTLLRHSVVLIAELGIERERRGAPMTAEAAGGVRWQWTPTLVLLAGAERRLSRSGADVGFTVGVSRTFVWRGL